MHRTSRVVLLSTAGLLMVLGLGVLFGTLPGQLLLSSLTDTSPAPWVTKRMRHHLESVEEFQKARQSGQSRVVVRVPLTAMGIPMFEDHWAVRFYRGDYLVRLATMAESDTGTYFSRQCDSDACRFVVQRLTGGIRWAQEHGMIHPVWINLTSSPQTTVTGPRLSTASWKQSVKQAAPTP